MSSNDYRVSIAIRAQNHAVREYEVAVQERRTMDVVAITTCFTEECAMAQLDDYRDRLNGGWCP